MTRALTRQFFVGCLVTATLVVSVASAFARQPNAEALYLEGRRLFEALEYENALKALDQAIAALESAGGPMDATRRDRLAAAYEMRARSKFGLGNQDEAKADFAALIKLNPGYVLTGQVSPRVVSLFEETVASMVTTLAMNVSPTTAKVTLDDAVLPTTGTVKVLAGDHILSAEQRGYKTARQPITAKVGETTEVTISLERVSAVIAVLTMPPDVEVTLDGQKVGTTTAGPPSGEYRDLVAKAGVPASAVSAELVIGDVTPGPHVIELTRECMVKVTNRLSVDKPDDFAVGPVKMEPAMATLTVQANEAGAQVVIDGRERGLVPYSTAELCEGPHVVEVRSKFGRDSRRIEARAGETIAFDGVIKPAFAIVSASSETANLDADLRLNVERAFAPARTVTVLAPPADQTDRALKANQLPNAWLAMDAEGRALGAAAQIGGPTRADVSSKLATTFGMQGVASVTALDRNRVVLALLAPGSGTPDILDVRLDRPESIAAAIERLDRGVSLTRPSIGLLAVDVADVAGAVVAAVDANGPAAAAKVMPGDVIVAAGGQPVPDASALAKLVASHKAEDPMSLDLKDASGATKKAEVKVFMTPRVIGLADLGILVNRVLLDLRARLAAATDPFQQSVIRLNAAVALVRLGDCTNAREELKQVQLPDRPGVGTGTVHYLTGLCAEAQGNRAEADAAFKAAAATDSLLTEDGPSVRELAEAKLAQPTRPTGQ